MHLIYVPSFCIKPYTNNSLQLLDVLQYFVEVFLLKQYCSVLFEKLVIFSDFVKIKKSMVSSIFVEKQFY